MSQYAASVLNGPAAGMFFTSMVPVIDIPVKQERPRVVSTLPATPPMASYDLHFNRYNCQKCMTPDRGFAYGWTLAGTSEGDVFQLVMANYYRMFSASEWVKYQRRRAGDYPEALLMQLLIPAAAEQFKVTQGELEYLMREIKGGQNGI